MSTRLPTLSQAAKKIGIGPRKLLAHLRLRKIIDQDNYPRGEYTNNGFFKTEQRAHPLGQTGKQRNYFVTVVTDEGLFFLQEIVHELRGSVRIHGSNGADRATAEPEPTPLLSGDRAGAVRGVPQ